MLNIDKKYTSEELRCEYAKRSRKLFDEHQKWRRRCSLWNTLLLFSVMLLSILVTSLPWCTLAIFGIPFGMLVVNLNTKTVLHALARYELLTSRPKIRAHD
jgi:hypothetical protein